MTNNNKKHTTLVEVCINPKLKQTAYKPLDDCIIGYDKEGKEIRVSDLLAFYYTLNEKYTKLNDKYLKLNEEHNTLVIKYNALLAAYKSNVAKTAMQFLDLEESK